MELVLVIGATIVIAALTLPMGMNFLNIQMLDEAAGGILETLRRANSQAVSQKNDSDFGVKFLADSYVLFQGGSYATRAISEDEDFVLSDWITVSGTDEIIFTKLTGVPDVAGVLTVSAGGKDRVIEINSQGRISWQ